MSTKTKNTKPEMTVNTPAEKVDKDKKYDGIIEYDTPAYKARKRHFRDRYDGRYLKTAPSMLKLMPYLMKVRADSQNQFEDVIDITNIEKYLAVKKKEGYTDMSSVDILVTDIEHCIGTVAHLMNFTCTDPVLLPLFPAMNENRIERRLLPVDSVC